MVSQVVKKEGVTCLMSMVNLGHMVAYCSAWQGRKESGIDLQMRDEGDGEAVRLILEKYITKEGTRCWDPPPGRPVVKDLRGALRKSRKGEGKGGR